MKIKIFLASSITEFETDRMSFAVYLNKLNTIFTDRYGVSISPFICETADHSVSKKRRKQDDYNDEIADSDVVIFLLGNHLGEFTQEEFRFSCNKLKENNHPRIYVYFCNTQNNSKDIADFKKVLETEYQHYYDTFEYIDTVKLSTLFNLRRLAFPSMKIEIIDDYFFIDRKKFLQDILSPSNIQAFNNNEEIKMLKERYNEADKKNRIIIKRRINEIQNDILNVFLDLSNYTFNGEYNCRVSEAIRLLENGDKIKAIAALDNAHNRDRRAARKRVRQMETLDDIGRLKFEINIRKTDNEYSKIDKLYQEAIEYALEDSIGLKILYDYASWLSSVHRVDEAIKTALQLKNLLSVCALDVLSENNLANMDLANLHLLLGGLYSKLSKFKEAYSAYREAFSFWGECIDSITDIQLWTLAEYIEDVACFIQQVPDSVSDLIDPFNYNKGVCIGQLATDIIRLRKTLQDNNQIDFSTLEDNPIYKSGAQHIKSFEDNLSKGEKQCLIPDSVTFVFDNPILESYILMLFVLCIKQSILEKTNDYVQYAKGLAMTILNISTIKNIMHDYGPAEEGANLAIKYLMTLLKLDTSLSINEDMVQAYGVLYTCNLNRRNISEASKNQNKMLEYGEKAYIEHPREFALTYADMLFHMGTDYIYSSNYGESIEIFDKLINLYISIEEDKEIDKTQYLIPFFLSNLKWIEAYSEFYRSKGNIQPDFNNINSHFEKAIYLFDYIKKQDTFEKLNKVSCVLEMNWCNLLYLPPISHQDACIDIMQQALEMCMALSLENNFSAYPQWKKTLEVVIYSSKFIYFCCDSEPEKLEWLKNLYTIFTSPIDFIINNAKLDPLRLIPSHFRHLNDYIFQNSPNINFLNDYKTVLYLLYEALNDCEDDVGGVKQQLIKKISSSYSEIIKQANSLENRLYILAILEKEKSKILKKI